MRPFELILIVLTAIILFLPAAHQRTRLRAASAIWLATLLLHFWLEQARWQLTPVYLAGVWAALAHLLPRRNPSRALRRLGRAGGALLLAIGVALGALFPIVRLGALPGDHSVGTLTFELVDAARPEPYGDDGGPRTLMVQVWYPALADTGAPAQYIPGLATGGAALAREFDLPPVVLSHVNLIRPHARVDATPATAVGPFPLLLFSHGLYGIRTQNSEQIEALVSQGYVVAAADHAYAASFSVFPDGRIALYDDDVLLEGDAYVPSAQRLVSVWADDLAAILDRLTQRNAAPAGSDPLAGLLNLDQVGVFGHSTGGGAAYEFCFRDARCGAALGLDPWVVPTSDAAIATGLPVPTLILRTPAPVSAQNTARLAQFWQALRAPAYDLVVAGSRHYDYTDFKRLSPLLAWVGMLGTVEPDQMHTLQTAYTRAFFDHHLRGWNGALLFAPAADFPEVTLRRR